MSTPVLNLSSEGFQVQNNDESGTTYVCDCGEEYMSEETLRRHQQNNCKNRSVMCSFCAQIYPSSTALREHLLSCGNKTDECPKCHQRIRRSHFAYHYENNCAPVDRVETPPNQRKIRLIHFPTNSNKPISREDIPSDDYSENNSGQNSLIIPPRVNGRLQSPVSSIRNSPVTIECEYCHNRCTQNDYKIHKDKCLQNPININQKQVSSQTHLRQNQNNSKGVAHIPCEICNQLVDIPNWSRHIQSCREQDAQRIANRARIISKEPVTEQLPCEYCGQLYSAKQLHLHQETCVRNPDNINSAAKLARPRASPPVLLPIKLKDNERQPTPSNNRSASNPRFAHYQSIDIDKTHAANRSLDNDRFNNYQNSIRRSASDEIVLHSENPSRAFYANENGHNPYDNMSQPYRQELSNGTSQRTRSSSTNGRNIKENKDIISNSNDVRSQYYNDGEYRDRVHNGSNRREPISNDPKRSLMKKKKTPSG